MRTRLLLAAVLLLSACSGDPDTQPPLTRTAPPPTVAGLPTPSPSPTALPVRLTGDGIETADRVLSFGDAFEDVQPALVAALGEPTKDTGVGESFSSYGTCPGTKLRALEFGGGALYVLFGDVIGPGLTMYQWSLTEQGDPDEVPRASALVGDTATYEFGVGETVADIREGVAGGATVEVFPGEEPFPPSLRLVDQSSGFFAALTRPDDTGTTTLVQAGEACGE